MTASGFSVVGPERRGIGDLPKIGIRPAIDGRRQGVRESLEAQTMGQAQRVAALLSERLRHPSGHAVECVVAMLQGRMRDRL